MQEEKIIYTTPPVRISVYGTLILIIIGAYFIYIVNSLMLQLLMGSIFVFIFIFRTLKNFYKKKIIISENHIELIKTRLAGKKASKRFMFSEIERIKYNKGGYRQDSAIYLKTKENSNIKVPVTENSFQLGPILKFLNDKGIKINLVHSDHELRLYLDGKIKSFPMSSKAEVDTKNFR